MRSNALLLIFQFKKIYARFEHTYIDASCCFGLKDALTKHIVDHNFFNGFRWQIEVKRIGCGIRVYLLGHLLRVLWKGWRCFARRGWTLPQNRRLS